MAFKTEQELKDAMIKNSNEGLLDFIKRNLRLDHKEDTYGFNGSHHEISLVFMDEVVDSIFIDIDANEG